MYVLGRFSTYSFEDKGKWMTAANISFSNGARERETSLLEVIFSTSH